VALLPDRSLISIFLLFDVVGIGSAWLLDMSSEYKFRVEVLQLNYRHCGISLNIEAFENQAASRRKSEETDSIALCCCDVAASVAGRRRRRRRRISWQMSIRAADLLLLR
jgi:hypothetical protein